MANEATTQCEGVVILRLGDGEMDWISTHSTPEEGAKVAADEAASDANPDSLYIMLPFIKAFPGGAILPEGAKATPAVNATMGE